MASAHGQYAPSLVDTPITVPHDRNGSFHSPLLQAHQTSTNELEDTIIGLYAKGLSVRDIQSMLKDAYGVEVSPATISTVTDKAWGLVEAWQNRPLAAFYPIIYLDAIHLKLRREGKVQNTAVSIVLGIYLEGQRDVLGHWVGNGAEGANFPYECGVGEHHIVNRTQQRDLVAGDLAVVAQDSADGAAGKGLLIG